MKFKRTIRPWFWLAIALLASSPIFAASTDFPVDEPVDVSAETGPLVYPGEAAPFVLNLPGPWSQHRYGFYVGTLGDPAPSLASFNVALHANDYIRLHAGVGYTPLFVDSATTYGGGILFRAFGQRAFSPVFGLAGAGVRVRLATLSGIFEAMFPKTSVKPWDQTFYVGTAKVGLDWQSPGGFNAGVGLQLLFAQIKLPLPYLHLGWFF